jgi:ABC-2 type transport system ATP-binding protein
MTSAISVRGLTKRYGENTAVAGLDLEVARGEVFALLGPNGAGKTTTVEILEGYRRRDGGEVSVLGIDPATATASWRNRVGIVLQGTGEFDDLTVGELVRHFAMFYTRPADPEQVIAAVGLADKHRARTDQLSGGQKRRLDVALGIVGQPELLFLDEPTTGFDPEARREFWELIRALSGGGTTILLTTHYLDEAEALAGRVGVIAAGRMLAVASPDQLHDRDHAPATISWRDGSGQVRSEQTNQPAGRVAELVSQYGELTGLTVTRPSLEDVYLQMITEAAA